MESAGFQWKEEGKTRHTVRKGECLFSIARQHSSDVRQMLAANPTLGEDPNRIFAGQELRLPTVVSPKCRSTPALPTILNGPLAYVRHVAWKPRPSFVKIQVMQGDTLHRIATVYRTSVEDVQRINNLPSTDICIGQHLYVSKPSRFGSVLSTSSDLLSMNGVGGPDISERTLKGIAQRQDKGVQRRVRSGKATAPAPRQTLHESAPLRLSVSSTMSRWIRRNTFFFPVDERIVSSGYGMRWGRMHQGVDFAAEIGASIHASASGTVSFAGYDGPGYGNLVELAHADGYITRYAHCHEISVLSGQSVDAGQVIGSVGETGRASGPHLHFEIRQNDKSIDPLQLLR